MFFFIELNSIDFRATMRTETGNGASWDGEMENIHEVESKAQCKYFEDLVEKNKFGDKWFVGLDYFGTVSLFGGSEHMQVGEAVRVFEQLTGEDFFCLDHDGGNVHSIYGSHKKPTPSTVGNNLINDDWIYVNTDIVGSAMCGVPFTCDADTVKFLEDTSLYKLTPKGSARVRAHRVWLMIAGIRHPFSFRMPIVLTSVNRMARTNDFEAMNELFSFESLFPESFLATEKHKHVLPSRASALALYKQRIEIAVRNGIAFDREVFQQMEDLGW